MAENKEKKPVAPVAVAIIITIIISIGAFQVFWYGPIKAKNIAAEKKLNEKEAIIVDLGILLKKEKTEFGKFKSDAAKQFLKMTEKTKALEKKKSRFSTVIKKISTRWNSFQGNICMSKIIPDTVKWAKVAETEIENENN